MIIILAVCVAVILVIWFIKFWFFPVVYPTSSAPRQLSFVGQGGFSNRPVITLSQYIDEQHIADYILTIENGVTYYEPQTYKLPNISEGTVVITVELGDEIDSSFSLYPIQASELLEKGLLIYTLSDNDSRVTIENTVFRDRYVNIVSGNDRIIYFLSGKDNAASYSFEEVGGFVEMTLIRTPEWSVVTDGPPLRRLPSSLDYYSKRYSGWRENEWVRIEIESHKHKTLQIGLL